ncbi:MAG: hypothetical protein K6U09_12650, partial [Acidobacteriia bacterium]|nr:hypothetical protein [Terriglobia bacterium]
MQRIAHFLWLAKLNNAMLFHGGVSPLFAENSISTIEFQQRYAASSTHTPESIIALDGNRQYVSFIDPKGLRNLEGPED